jgi:hypothetical protein
VVTADLVPASDASAALRDLRERRRRQRAARFSSRASASCESAETTASKAVAEASAVQSWAMTCGGGQATVMCRACRVASRRAAASSSAATWWRHSGAPQVARGRRPGLIGLAPRRSAARRRAGGERRVGLVGA